MSLLKQLVTDVMYLFNVSIRMQRETLEIVKDIQARLGDLFEKQEDIGEMMVEFNTRLTAIEACLAAKETAKEARKRPS